MTTANIFFYKNHVGVDINMNRKFLNDLTDNNQLGCVISTKEINISQEAVDFIKKLKRDTGSFAEIMMTRKQDDHQNASISFLGFGKILVTTETSISRTCDLTVLDECNIVENQPDERFKEIINKR